jgi:hypothetical protein
VQRAEPAIWRRRPGDAVRAIDRLGDLLDDTAVHPCAVFGLALGLRAVANLRDVSGEPPRVRRCCCATAPRAVPPRNGWRRAPGWGWTSSPGRGGRRAPQRRVPAE